MFEYFLIGCLCFATYYIILLFCYQKHFQQGFIGDTSWHYLIIKQWKQEKKYDGIPNLIMRDGPDFYPIFFHKLVALMPDRIVRYREYFINFMFGLFFYGVYYIFILKYIHKGFSISETIHSIFLFSLILFTQPHQIILKNDRILYVKLSERFFAALLSSGSYILLYFYIATDNFLYAFLSSILGAISLITSLFSRQVLVFSCVLISVIILRIEPIIMLFSSFFLAYIFEGRFFIGSLHQQIQFLYTYCKLFKHGTLLKEDTLDKGYPTLKEALSKKTLGSFAYVFYSRPPLKFLLDEFEVFILLVLCLLNGGLVLEIQFLLVPIILCLLTASKTLNFLGEAERYLHYLLKFFLPFLYAKLLLGYDYFSSIILWLSYIAFRIFLFKNSRQASIVSPSKDLVSGILSEADIQVNDVFFCVPHTLGSAVYLRKGCFALTHQGVRFPIEFMRKIIKDPPFLNDDREKIFKEYRITHVLLNNTVDTRIKLQCTWFYDFSDLIFLAENELYKLFKVPRYT